MGKYVGFWLAVIATSLIFFQNCGSEVGFNQAPSEENPFGFGQTRSIELDPNDEANRPPIHLTTIVDNSNSTQYIQDNLKAGFSKAITKVRGFNVLSSLYTMSHDENWDKPSSIEEDIVSYVDANGVTIELPASDISQIPVNINYVEKTVYRLTDPFFANGQALSIAYDSPNFSQFTSLYSDGVSNIGTGGSPDELGLCTLLKKIEDNQRVSDPNNLAYHLYVLATNEDDVTTLQNCPIESRRETTFTQSTKTENCTSGADCKFRYSIQQNPDIQDEYKLNYNRNSASTRIFFEASRIKEVYKGAKETASHSISYQKKQSTYTYAVVKNCPNDNINEPCKTTETKSKTLNGSCSGVGSSQVSCNSAQKDTAETLFGVAGNSTDFLHSCKVKCDESFKNENLPKNKIPLNGQLCGSASTVQRACNNTDKNAVASHISLPTSDIGTCTYKCVPGSSSKTITKVDEKSSCGSTPSVSTISSIVAPSLGIPANEVINTSYSCTKEEPSGSRAARTSLRTIKSNAFNCDPSETGQISCNNAERDWLAGNINVKKSNITRCYVQCSQGTSNASLDISSNYNSCPKDKPALENELKQLAASHAKTDIANINSFSVNCSQKTINKPACVLESVAGDNFCSKSSEVAAQCSALGRNDLNMNSCSRSNGKKEVVSIKKEVGPLQNITIGDLPGVDKNKPVEGMVADRLNAVHGANGFFTSFFIHPSNDPSCRAPSNLSSGLKYEGLSGELGPKNSAIFPVCLNDYSPALDSVIQIAIDNASTTFNLNVDEEEVVFRIYANFYDGRRELIPESDYEIFKKTVMFKDREFLADVKSLEFDVWRAE